MIWMWRTVQAILNQEYVREDSFNTDSGVMEMSKCTCSWSGQVAALG